MSAPNKWGKTPAEFIHDLEGKFVLVALSNGKSFKGTLVGVDPYSFVLKQSSGLEMMINKGNLLYIHPTSEA
ncbi:MAG: LSM domain-containing protein [Anaerolineales bacterium]